MQRDRRQGGKRSVALRGEARVATGGYKLRGRRPNTISDCFHREKMIGLRMGRRHSGRRGHGEKGGIRQER